MSETPAQVPRKRAWPSLVIILAATLGSAAAIALLIRDSAAVYSELSKPVFAPPGWVFPAAWSVLYVLMSAALWRMLLAEERHTVTILLYVVQLAVNLAWPVLFFHLRAYGLAFVWLLVLLALAVLLIGRAFCRSHLAGWLLLPYAAWIIFAGVLNFVIAQMKP